MERFSIESKLEILPDEILLEICQYLLCVDILQSFYGLNSRMTRMITKYCHHVSLHKASIAQSSYLCTNVLPQIGSHIRSLLIDRCYSVMQQELFMEHFSKNMSIIFPNLKKISLVGFQHAHIITFFESLHDLNKLVEIRIYDLFGIQEDHQATVLQTLLQANNNLLTSVLINNGSSCLKFNDTDCYVNIVRLRIKIKTIMELPSLFTALPYIRHLDVTLGEDENDDMMGDEINVCSLHYLIDFQLRSTKRWWKLEELSRILAQLPNVQTISLFLCVTDSRLVRGNTLLPLLSSTVRQFHYAVFYAPVTSFDETKTIIASWPSSHPITCCSSDDYGFLHTLPWYFKCMSFPTSIGKLMSSQTNREIGYETRVKKLEVIVDKNLTLAMSLSVIAQCHQMRQLVIFVTSDDNSAKVEQYRSPCLPTLSQLTQIYIYASIPVDFTHLFSIFVAAPNLLRLDLPCDYLIHLLENQQIRDLLKQSIKSLVILDGTASSLIKLNEEHIHFIASTLTNLCDVYADIKHLTPSPKTELNEITTPSMESMVKCLLSEFKTHKLISLVVDIQPNENLVTNAKQWLQENTILQQEQFNADFNRELKRLVIWM
ncbi:unnamed protein product [Adineta steineri]|uniref:F-box domain-containing protein n=1 Tax=Adineta steineri TaxID=433720 RepID=A0A813P8V4_9BILA|nr:unnamed protein product [Adineta steineri]